MRFVHGRLLALPALVLLLSGCAATREVRYVYQDRDFGVIGMPENSDRWPTRYRRQAERMMKAHFPDGHEIVRAEEVVEGTRTLTVQGTNTAEVLPAVPTALLQVARLGRSSCRSQADKLALKECRIVYHRAGRPVGPDVYAPLATLTPTRYVDPNTNTAEHHPARAFDESTREKAKPDNAPEPPLDLALPEAAHAAQPSGRTAVQNARGTANPRASNAREMDKPMP